ncbi:uncharacterized protein TNIN_173351 [Trichonephila inaurata madagascariensis]|uniref:Uncharacterized protein n=1 Tax=Trichonephila inaurata madagascariensis TaxID=2747483 RepID=A0A8X6YWJ3_9ARAC|nr:uncharacterized protein TNIN_173351 [Trichonephila inaurata madagascariensis]
MPRVKQQLLVLFCVKILFPVVLGVDNDITKVTTSRDRYFDSLNNKLYDENEDGSRFYETSSYSELSNSLDSYKSPKNEVPSRYEEFTLDENDNDKYSYGTGGFYFPSTKQSEQNYFIEEINNKDNKQNSSLVTINDSSKKGTNVPSILEKAEFEIFERPSIISLMRKLFLSPMVLNFVAAVAPTFIIEIIFPYLLRIFGGTVMPVVTSRISRGFARSLDGFYGLHTEKLIDAIQEYGARAMKDPRCFQRFFCFGAKSYFENSSRNLWSIQKVVRKLSKAVDERLWNALGLRQLLNSMQRGNCDSLVCSEMMVDTKDILSGEEFQN